MSNSKSATVTGPHTSGIWETGAGSRGRYFSIGWRHSRACDRSRSAVAPALEGSPHAAQAHHRLFGLGPPDASKWITLPTLLSVCLTYQWPHCESNPSIRTCVRRYTISGETVPALKIQYQSFGRSGPDIWSTHTNPTMNSTTNILFILVSYSFRFLQIEQTDLDQFVGHVGERLAFLQGAFPKSSEIPAFFNSILAHQTIRTLWLKNADAEDRWSPAPPIRPRSPSRPCTLCSRSQSAALSSTPKESKPPKGPGRRRIRKKYRLAGGGLLAWWRRRQKIV